jgi:hypothetical protein
MKFNRSFFGKNPKLSLENNAPKQRILVGSEITDSEKEAINRREASNEILASIYDHQVLPIIDKLIGKKVSDSIVGSIGISLFFTDGSWLAAYLMEGTVTWQLSNLELSKEIEDLMNSTEPGNAVTPLSVDEIKFTNEALSNTYGKEISGVSSGLINGIKYIKYSFPDHGELFTSIGPSWNNKYSCWIRWYPPIRLIWRGKSIGFLLDQENDMYLWDGVWESNDTEQAKAFEKLVSKFDPKSIIRDLKLGTLLEWQEGDKESMGYLVVLGINDRRLFLRWITGQDAIEWAKQNIR